MFETFLQMQIIHQKPFNKVVSFDSQPLTLLVSTAIDRTQKQPEVCKDVHF
jgi:chaperone required for assembly of F1-ATPase